MYDFVQLFDGFRDMVYMEVILIVYYIFTTCMSYGYWHRDVMLFS